MHRTSLEDRIMKRVYGIWLFRRVAYSSYTRLFLLGVLALIASPHVSFTHIFRNISVSGRSVQGFATYLLDASQHTEFIVKVAAVGVFLLTILFLLDASRAFARVLAARRTGHIVGRG